jgi:hypothetical protein
MNIKTVVIVSAVAVAGYLAYRKFFTGKQMHAKYLTSKGFHGDFATLIGFEEGYVAAWYKAAKKGASSFDYNGATYNTKGGTKVK